MRLKKLLAVRLTRHMSGRRWMNTLPRPTDITLLQGNSVLQPKLLAN